MQAGWSRVAADFDEIAIGIVEVDRSEGPAGAGLFHRAFDDRNAFGSQAGDRVLGGRVGKQAEIAGADTGVVACFLAQRLQVDLLIADLKGQTALAEADQVGTGRIGLAPNRVLSD